MRVIAAEIGHIDQQKIEKDKNKRNTR